MADAGVEEIACVNAGRIVVVILRARRRYPDSRGPVLRRRAGCQGRSQRWKYISAKKSRLYLLVRGKPGQIDRRGGIGRKRHRTGNQAAVKAPVHRNPRPPLPRLVMDVGGLPEFLIMVNAEYTGGRIGARTADLRPEEARGGTAENGKCRQPVIAGHAHANPETADLRVVPGNREENRRVEQNTEIVSAVRVLPQIVGVHDRELAKGLLKAGMELIAPARRNRS